MHLRYFGCNMLQHFTIFDNKVVNCCNTYLAFNRLTSVVQFHTKAGYHNVHCINRQSTPRHKKDYLRSQFKSVHVVCRTRYRRWWRGNTATQQHRANSILFLFHAHDKKMQRGFQTVSMCQRKEFNAVVRFWVPKSLNRRWTESLFSTIEQSSLLETRCITSWKIWTSVVFVICCFK